MNVALANCHKLARVDEEVELGARTPGGSRAPRRAQQAGRMEWFGLDTEECRRLVALETAALERLFDASFDALYAFARRMVRSDASAEDVAQDVFVKLLHALPRYRVDQSLRRWVFAIASNTIRDHFAARAARERNIPESLEITDVQQRVVAPAVDPGAGLERKELARTLEHAVRNLTPLLREAVVLRHIHGLSIEEVAGALSIREEAVRQRCARGLRELRLALPGLAPEAQDEQ